MLLVTFHGGSGGISNVYAYDTTTGALLTQGALQQAPPSEAELRGMICANSLFYVVDGGKVGSNILCYNLPAAGSNNFKYIGEFIGPSVSKSKGKFKNSIGHPYGMVFDTAGNCYISNQDTNVVAVAEVASDFQTAAVKKGCRSSYLNGVTSICPTTGCVYLDGTFVASQMGTLPDVDVDATDVPAQYGGLAVSFSTDTSADTGPADHSHSKSKDKVQNSVRDVAIWGSVLLVCDEPASCVRLYSLPDGSYLGASNVPKSPTHLAICSNGLYVSAGNQLYWSALSSPLTVSSLSFQSVLTAPAAMNAYDVGGVTFDSISNAAYVAYQQGKGTTGSGAIYSYTVTPGSMQSSPPTLTNATIFATICADTPEFLLFLP